MGQPCDFIVYADESGDHGLKNINPDYPILVLSCCIFGKEDYLQRVHPIIQSFKLRWWPHDGVVLHTLQIKRQVPPFAFLKHKDKREHFMEDLTATLSQCPFTLIAGVIHKGRLKNQYANPDNPYSLALQFCMERVYSFLRDKDQQDCDVAFVVERRGKVEDQELEQVFRRVCDGDNRWGKLPGFSIHFVDKKANLPGLQVADLVSTPIGQYVHRPEYINRAFKMIKTKFWCSPNGKVEGWGFKVFP